MSERVRLKPRPPKPPKPPKRKTGVTILDAVNDKNLFAEAFKDKASWHAWRSFLASLFGLPLNQSQLQTFRECTGREHPPINGANEAWLVCGRRGGKSFTLSLIATYLATFRDWTRYLQRGEKATVMIIAVNRRQAQVILRFITGLLNGSPLLKDLIEHQGKEAISLTNQVQIEVHTASFKSTRGYCIVAALIDEIAFLPHDDNSAEPDEEVLASIRPGMAMVDDAMLLCASSPYAKKGALWDNYRKHYGKDSDVLVWKAPTRTMNPLIKQSWVDSEIERDVAKNTAEYMAEFRSDIEAFVSREVVEACVALGVHERMPQPNINCNAFVDMSGGSSDSAALAIASNDTAKDTVIIHCIRERRAPHSPEQVVEEFSKILKSYSIFKVTGDHYAGEWPAEAFRKFGITYETSQKTKGQIYVDFLPLLNSGRVSLLDESTSINQLCALERTTARGGREIIDHPPNSRDDVCNAMAGAATNAALPYGNYDIFYGMGREDTAESVAEEARAWRVNGLLQHIYRTAR